MKFEYIEYHRSITVEQAIEDLQYAAAKSERSALRKKIIEPLENTALIPYAKNSVRGIMRLKRQGFHCLVLNASQGIKVLLVMSC